MLVLARRFEEAYDLVSAWGWNIAHLPGTLSRRRKIQKQRRAKDRTLRRFMESAGLRIPRWFQTAERILEEQREIEEGDEGQPVTRRLRDRTASLVGTHPVIVASFLGVVIGAVAVRGLLGPEAIAGGVLPRVPVDALGVLRRARLRVSHHLARRDLLAQPRARPARWRLRPALRQHRPRAEGRSWRGCRRSRRCSPTGRSHGSPAGPARRSWRRPRTASPRSCCGRSRRAGSHC